MAPYPTMLARVLRHALAVSLIAAPVYAQNISRTVAASAGPFDHEAVRAEVIESDDIERSGAQRLDEVLEELAGIQLTQASGLATSAVVDGMPATQVTIVVDGVPVSRPVNTRAGPMVDLAALAIPVSRIRRVEIHRGVGPTGSGDQGGIVVHIVTDRRVEAARFDAAASTGVLATSSSAEAPIHTGSVELAGAVPFGPRWGLDLRAQGEREHAADVNSDDVPDLPLRQLVSGTVGVRWAESRRRNLELHLSGRQANTERASLTRDAIAAIRADVPERLNGVVDDRTQLRALDLGIRGRWSPGDRTAFRHDHSFQAQEYRFDKELVRTGEIERNHRTTDLSTRHAAWWTVQRSDHRIEPELVARFQAVRRDQGSDGSTGFQRDLGGVGIGLTEQWAPGETVQVDARGFAEFHSAYGPGGVAGAGIAWKPLAWMQLRLSASHTRRVPAAEELWFRFDHSSVGYTLTGNPDLAPETLTGARTGIALSNDTLGIEAEGYWQTLEQAITVETDSSEPGQVGAFRYTNEGNVRSAGLNVSAFARALPGGLQVRGRYALLPYSRVSATGRRLPLSATHDVRLRLLGQWLGDRVSAWADVDARSALAAPEGTAAGESAVALGMGAAWSHASGLRVQVQVSNLLDATDAAWGPKPGRLITLGIRYSWEGRT